MLELYSICLAVYTTQHVALALVVARSDFVLYISRMLNDDQVRHVAKLARIKLTDGEVKKFGKQLSSVLEYIDILAEVDTKDVVGTSQVTGLTNVMDKDEVIKGQSTKAELLKCSELPVDSGQVRVIRVVK